VAVPADALQTNNSLYSIRSGLHEPLTPEFLSDAVEQQEIADEATSVLVDFRMCLSDHFQIIHIGLLLLSVFSTKFHYTHIQCCIRLVQLSKSTYREIGPSV